MKKSAKEIFNKPELSLVELISYFWDRRKVLFVSIVILVIIGAVRFSFTPDTYESVSVKLVEIDDQSQSAFGRLGSLVSLPGINFGSSAASGGISSDMYPEIISSKPFLIELVNEKFYFQSQQDSVLLKDYLIEDYSSKPMNFLFGFVSSIPNRVFSFFSDKETVVSPVVMSALEENGVSQKFLLFSNEEDLSSELLKSRIKVEEEGKMITLSVKMPESLVAAELNNVIFEKIVKYVTDYKTKKMRSNLEFVEERALEAKSNFIKSQMALASFRDSNQGIISQRIRSREQQLEAEYNIAFNLYNTLNQELETSRIQLKKDTPIFSDFAPALVPNSPINMSFFKTLIIFAFLGILVGFGVIIFIMAKDYFL